MKTGGVSMKNKDVLIMSYLRQDSRMALSKLSKKTGIPISTIFDRLKLKGNGIIERHTALINFGMLGFTARAQIMLKSGKHDKKKLEQYLIKSFNVNNLYKVNNGFDFLIECICRDLKEMEDFLDKIDKQFVIKTKEVHYIVEDLRREAFLSDPQTVELVLKG